MDARALVETDANLSARTVSSWTDEAGRASVDLQTGATITYVTAANGGGRAVTVSLGAGGALKVIAADRHGSRAVVLHDGNSVRQATRFASRWLPINEVVTLPIVGFEPVEAED
jgi:hypothetical protein